MRDRNVDILKGFGILLVVIGHLNPGTFVEKWIYSFHMFLFFFLSGYLFRKRDSFRKQVQASLRAYVVPYFFWSICAIAFSLFIEEYTLRTALRALLYLDSSVCWNSPVWFLVVTMWLRLISQLTPQRAWAQVAIILVGLVLGYTNLMESFPFGLGIVPTAIVFFAAGMLVRSIQNRCSYAPPFLAEFC